MNDHRFLRFSALCAVVGAFVWSIFGMLRPQTGGPENLAQVLQSYSESVGQFHAHGLGMALGSFIIIVGYIGLYRSLSAGNSAAWAQCAIIAAAVGTAVWVISPVNDGFLMANIAGAYTGGSGEAAGMAIRIADAVFTFTNALFAVAIVLLGTPVLLFGIAILSSRVYPKWLGIAGIIIGLLGIANGIGLAVAVGLAAAGTITTMKTLFIPVATLTPIWVLIVGILLWRRAAAVTSG